MGDKVKQVVQCAEVLTTEATEQVKEVAAAAWAAGQEVIKVIEEEVKQVDGRPTKERKQARIIVAMEQLKYLNHSPCIHTFPNLCITVFSFSFLIVASKSWFTMRGSQDSFVHYMYSTICCK